MSSKAPSYSEIDTSGFPDFYDLETPLEMGLWVLWVTKEKLQKRALTEAEIAQVALDWKEVSIAPRSLTNSFNKAGDKIHRHQDGTLEITMRGKEYLTSRSKAGSTELFYFEPGKRYSSKIVLSQNILAALTGEISIVDPYCGQRTLDILKTVENAPVRFLTKIHRIRQPERNRLIRDLRDFKIERPNIEFRDSAGTDMHDRYIISSNCLVLLGHSMKDLGGKESFAVVLDGRRSKDVVDILRVNFDTRWNQSQPV